MKCRTKRKEENKIASDYLQNGFPDTFKDELKEPLHLNLILTSLTIFLAFPTYFKRNTVQKERREIIFLLSISKVY